MEDINQILDSKASKMNFMKGLIILAKADGNLADSETVFFMNAASGLGLDGEDMLIINEIIESSSLENDVKFVNKKQTLFFMREAIQLCLIDDNYHKKEKKAIDQIRINNSLSQESLNEIESWVNEGLNWKARGKKLLELEG